MLSSNNIPGTLQCIIFANNICPNHQISVLPLVKATYLRTLQDEVAVNSCVFDIQAIDVPLNVCIPPLTLDRNLDSLGFRWNVILIPSLLACFKYPINLPNSFQCLGPGFLNCHDNYLAFAPSTVTFVARYIIFPTMCWYFVGSSGMSNHFSVCCPPGGYRDKVIIGDASSSVSPERDMSTQRQ
jgi:hypothetical protein